MRSIITMSKHHVPHTHARVLNDIRRLPVEELQELYGIEVDYDGTVYDLTEMQEFDTLEDWATFIADQEQEDNFGTKMKIGGRQPFDDEY